VIGKWRIISTAGSAETKILGLIVGCSSVAWCPKVRFPIVSKDRFAVAASSFEKPRSKVLLEVLESTIRLSNSAGVPVMIAVADVKDL